MGDGMLRDILDIERQIEAELKAERARVDAWLEAEKEGIDRQVEEQLQTVASEACRDSESRCQQARDDGAERIRDLRRKLRSLKSISDDQLGQLVRTYLPQVTGAESHDHQDGQN